MGPFYTGAHCWNVLSASKEHTSAQFFLAFLNDLRRKLWIKAKSPCATECAVVLGKIMCPLPPQFWQLYNSVTLFRLARHEDCKEWQVRIALVLA